MVININKLRLQFLNIKGNISASKKLTNRLSTWRDLDKFGANFGVFLAKIRAYSRAFRIKYFAIDGDIFRSVQSFSCAPKRLFS